MTRAANARLAGFAYIFYIVVAFPAMVLEGRATAGRDMAARLANVAQHAPELHLAAVLSLLGCFCAITLAVTTYAITRDVDADLAMLSLACRVAEGVVGGAGILTTLGLLSVATAAKENPASVTSALPVGILVLQQGGPLVAATFFAVGSTIFASLLLRGRIVPVWLAWLGVASSMLIVVVLLMQLGGLMRGAISQLVWLPIAAFEIIVAFWLMIRGAAVPVQGAALRRAA